MSDPVFSAVDQRRIAGLCQAVVELGKRCRDMDEDGPRPVADYVTAPAAKDAVEIALAAGKRPTPAERDISTIEELRDQLLADGRRLELDAQDMSHPDRVNAHQGHGVGMQRAALRLSDFLARQADRLAAVS